MHLRGDRMSLGLIYKNEEHIFDEVCGQTPFLTYPMFDKTGIVRNAFSTRMGGVSEGYYASLNLSFDRGDDRDAVLENFRRIAAAIGTDCENMVLSRQTHTTNVRVVTEEDKGKGTLKERNYSDVDGLVTNVPGICLVTSYADCVPLYFVDPVKKVIGLSHSGWRGTVGKIGKETVRIMCDRFGSDPSDILAAVGPSICQQCYEVSGDVIDQFKNAFDEGIVERKDLFIMTKVWNDMHEHVEEACKKSIADLQCDYVDMYYIHWPFPNYHAPKCDVESRNPDSKPFSVEEFMNTYRQCEKLVEDGLTRFIGISNMTIPKLEAVLPLMKIKPVACELEIHPCFQQQELYDYLVAHNIQPVGYMPIGSPMRPERDMCPEDVADLQTPVMQEIAKAHNCHPAIIALKWARQRGEIAIPFSLHNYVSNLKAMTEDPLTEEEMAKIATLEKGNRLVKGQVFLWHGAKDWHDLWDEDGEIVTL